MSKTRRLETERSGRGIWMDLWKWAQSIPVSHRDVHQPEFTAEERAESWSCACQAASFLGHLVLVPVSEMGTGACGRTQWQKWVLSLGLVAWTSSHQVLPRHGHLYLISSISFHFHRSPMRVGVLSSVHHPPPRWMPCVEYGVSTRLLNEWYDLLMQPSVSRGQSGWEKQLRWGPGGKNFQALLKE